MDYKIEAALETTPERKKNLLVRALSMLSPAYRKYRNEQIKMGETFHQFCVAYYNEFLPMLGISEERNECPELDALVIGSDEVFNCTQAGDVVGFSRQLFGKDHRSKKLISYAASFGSTTMEKLEKYGIDAEVGELLDGFDAISVRDRNSIEIVECLTGKTSEYHVDPVLAYEFPEVDDIRIELKDYIVVYAYAGRLREDEITAIQQFAKKKGKKILTLGFWQTFSDEYVLANPLEVLAYVKHADYVVTDTFHGTVFSIKYQVPFATIIRDSNKQKLSDLLERFNLLERRVEDVSRLENVLESLMPDIEKMIASEQAQTLEYLRKELDKKYE